MTRRLVFPVAVRIDPGLPSGKCLIWRDDGRCRYILFRDLDYQPDYRLILISASDAGKAVPLPPNE